MGGGLSAGCGGENINFSTPFGTIKPIKNKKCHRSKTYGKTTIYNLKE